MNTSFGYGNYNGMFVTVKMSNWHGMTLQSNFTYGKALGTGSQVQATSQYTISDPFDYGRNYGLQPWDRKFLFNMWIVYQPPFLQGQHGSVGHLLGGWTSLQFLTPVAACLWCQLAAPGLTGSLRGRPELRRIGFHQLRLAMKTRSTCVA